MGAREGMTLTPAYRNFRFRRALWVALVALSLASAVAIHGQDASAPPATPRASSDTPPATPSRAATTEPKPEISNKDTTTTFKLRVNLVQVKVVVRDQQGNLIENLQREDFQLFDQGKPQVISTFGVETAETRRKRSEAAAKTQAVDGVTPAAGETSALPERFVALMFDDIHLEMGDIIYVRKNAEKLINSMAPTDRLGVYTTSGQVTLEFTSDKEALLKKMLSLTPRPMMGKINSVSNCPDVNHYMADQWVNQGNQQVLGVVTANVLACQYQNNPQMAAAAAAMAQVDLQQALTAGDTDNEYTYRRLEDVLRRMMGMPGERVMVFVSPGFILSTQTLDEMGIIDRANRANVVINTVDARGLYTPDLLGDISQPVTETPQTAGYMATYRTQAQSENSFVLGDFANGTGGTFFQNSNDLETGLKRAGAAPEVSYVLGFSPQNQKMDGRFHTLKVVVTGKRKVNIQARRGYFAPKKVDDPQQQAKAEMAEAVFSQDEIQELPLDFQTQYFKTDAATAHLSVVSHIDLKAIHFRKADGRNYDDLTVDTVVFDENGNYVTGGEKILEMRLLDTTYERLSRTGVSMKSSFDLKPGKYMVRQVVRDSEGAQMAAKNGAVVIPY